VQPFRVAEDSHRRTTRPLKIHGIPPEKSALAPLTSSQANNNSVLPPRNNSELGGYFVVAEQQEPCRGFLYFKCGASVGNFFEKVELFTAIKKTALILSLRIYGHNYLTIRIY
jgi:hypothetical protein